MEKVYINFVFRICKRSRKTRSNSVTFYNITLLFKNFQRLPWQRSRKENSSSSLFPLLFHLLHSLQLLQYLQWAVLIKPCAQFQKSEHIWAIILSHQIGRLLCRNSFCEERNAKKLLSLFSSARKSPTRKRVNERRTAWSKKSGGGGVLRARYLRGGALINYSQFCVRFTRIISTANNYFNALILRGCSLSDVMNSV